MRLIVLALTLIIPVDVHAESAPEPSAPPVTADNRQLLLVRAPSWGASNGTLEQLERDPAGRWAHIGAEIPVALGRHGMAWGRGQHPITKPGPIKKEGDGKSPAGIFPLGRAFGRAETLPDAAHGFPYLQSQPSTYCVEDTRSTFYNQIIDSSEVSKSSWEKWSPLLRTDGLFDWGIVVRQNANDPARGAGSCVFLHIWRGPDRPTAGCTAMQSENLQSILRWLDGDANPLLVQLPEPIYAERRLEWALP